ncbi:MAG: mechanosensitive ion channel family protein [Oscillospiraceae bacterium]|jgi:small conductance mechanosensitive channel|nr:mechanosensitive ion channel family protein [Oscillospiraceae bacterium]
MEIVTYNEILLRIFVAIAVFLVLAFVSELISRAIKKAMFRISTERSVISFTYSASRVLFKVIALLFALTVLIDARAVFATIGTVAVAAGFIFKDVISNIISGIIIVSGKLFKVEDFIEVDQSKGYVFKIELFFTTLKTLDDQEIVIPNSILTSSIVINNRSFVPKEKTKNSNFLSDDKGVQDEE